MKHRAAGAHRERGRNIINSVAVRESVNIQGGVGVKQRWELKQTPSQKCHGDFKYRDRCLNMILCVDYLTRSKLFAVFQHILKQSYNLKPFEETLILKQCHSFAQLFGAALQ